MRDHVSALVEPAPLGQRPEPLEGLTVELDLGLVREMPGAALRGQQKLIALAAKPDLAVGADRQIALLDLVRLGPLEVGRIAARGTCARPPRLTP